MRLRDLAGLLVAQPLADADELFRLVPDFACGDGTPHDFALPCGGGVGCRPAGELVGDELL